MSIPIVLCGLSAMMGSRVAPRLLPEYEAIQFVTSVNQAKSDIAALQAGKQPQPDADGVGSHDYSRPLQAVLFGRGFDAAAVNEVYQACGGPSSGLTWLRADDESVATIAGKPPPPEELDRYADKTSAIVKEILAKIKAEGGWGKGGVHTYPMNK